MSNQNQLNPIEQLNEVFRQATNQIQQFQQFISFYDQKARALIQELETAQKNKIPKVDMPEKVPNNPEKKTK